MDAFRRFGFVVAALIAIPCLSGCAKDQNRDDYDRRQSEEDFGKLQAASGAYIGPVYSQATHEFLGTLSISLTPRMKVSAAPDSVSKAETQPVFSGQVMFARDSDLPMSIPDAAFEPGTSRFVADIPVARQNLATGASGPAVQPGSPDPSAEGEKLHIEGHIANGSFDGTIYAVGFNDSAGIFTLTTGTTPSAPVASALTQLRERLAGTTPDRTTYVGQTTFARSRHTRAVHLIVKTSRSSSEEQILDYFEAKKPVQIELDYGENLSIEYPSATLDDRTHLLRGFSTSQQGTDPLMSLECKGIRPQSFTCSHLLMSGGAIAVATTEVELATGTIQEIPAIATDNQSYVESFAGTTTFSEGASREAVLNITHARNDREKELLNEFFPYPTNVVQVSMNYGDNSNIALNNAKLDDKAGTLTGSFALSRGPNLPTTDSILTDCTRSQANWSCTFFNSSQGQTASGSYDAVAAAPGQLNASGDAAGALQPVQKTYPGSATYLDGTRAAVQLNVIKPPKSRTEDIADLYFPKAGRDNLQVTVVFPGPETRTLGSTTLTAAFTEISWDYSTGILQGNQPLVTNDAQGTTITGSLNCNGFTMADAGSPFTCSYKTNQLAGAIPLRFTGTTLVEKTLPSQPVKHKHHPVSAH